MYVNLFPNSPLDFIPFLYYNKDDLNYPRKEDNPMAFTVTKDTVIGEVLDYDSSLAEVFFSAGMHCVG